MIEKAFGYGGELAGRWGAKAASAQAWPATGVTWRMKGSAKKAAKLTVKERGQAGVRRELREI